MTISQEQRRLLKAQAHPLAPVIIIGNKGLTQNVSLETDRALLTHELIKVRINAEDRLSRQNIAAELCNECNAELIQIIGHIAIIYRKLISKDSNSNKPSKKKDNRTAFKGKDTRAAPRRKDTRTAFTAFKERKTRNTLKENDTRAAPRERDARSSFKERDSRAAPIRKNRKP